jgi:hypothetical protein
LQVLFVMHIFEAQSPAPVHGDPCAPVWHEL